MVLRVNGVSIVIAALVLGSSAVDAGLQPTDWISAEPVPATPGWSASNPPSSAWGGLTRLTSSTPGRTAECITSGPMPNAS